MYMAKSNAKVIAMASLNRCPIQIHGQISVHPSQVKGQLKLQIIYPSGPGKK